MMSKITAHKYFLKSNILFLKNRDIIRNTATMNAPKLNLMLNAKSKTTDNTTIKDIKIGHD